MFFGDTQLTMFYFIHKRDNLKGDIVKSVRCLHRVRFQPVLRSCSQISMEAYRHNNKGNRGKKVFQGEHPLQSGGFAAPNTLYGIGDGL
jgi:hypothetical protein